MSFSTILTEVSQDDLVGTARALAGETEVVIRAAGIGGNNRVYCVETACGRYAMKAYPRTPGDARDRLSAEFDGLRFLQAHDVECQPAALAADRQAGYGLYEWIEGEVIGTPGTADVDAAVDFLAALKSLRGVPLAAELPFASEACLSGRELCRQIDARLARLAGAATGHPELAVFLDRDLTPAKEGYAATARRRFDAGGIDFDADLGTAQRTLSPSDFGFHNAIRRPDGRVIFIDFEYFGWDDPVKLASDFVLHPGHVLSPALASRFLDGMADLFADDPAFGARQAALHPLYGIRWCLIMLAEFLPERMARRQIAGRHGDAAAARHTQLKKARASLAALRNSDGLNSDG